MNKQLSIFLIFLIAVSVSGCGYRLATPYDGDSGLTYYLSEITNVTNFSELDSRFRDEVMLYFSTRNMLSAYDEADVVVNIRLTSLVLQRGVTSQLDAALVSEMFITVQIDALDKAYPDRPYSKSFSRANTFYVKDGIEVSSSNFKEAFASSLGEILTEFVYGYE